MQWQAKSIFLLYTSWEKPFSAERRQVASYQYASRWISDYSFTVFPYPNPISVLKYWRWNMPTSSCLWWKSQWTVCYFVLFPHEVRFPQEHELFLPTTKYKIYLQQFNAKSTVRPAGKYDTCCLASLSVLLVELATDILAQAGQKPLTNSRCCSRKSFLYCNSRKE